MSKRHSTTPPPQPYSNMRARRDVLISGFVFSLAGFVLVLMACLFLFVPKINFFPQASPSVLLKWLLIAGIAICFIGTVLTVAGANTIKPLARFSMFLSTISFVVGAALLLIILLFRTILPLDAIERLSAALPNIL
ncbi:MAG: hypothetical protein NC037_02180 [Bacteroides sp.]|nr:hypothetical protein [Bacillota bacterium]MCM1393899.1 hypothetical protein [[Eubacterium] siraeum]MCM1455323.1 hypothetical protein [Bacteroides sp.]